MSELHKYDVHRWISDNARSMENGSELKAFYTLLDDTKAFRTKTGIRFDLPCGCFVIQDSSVHLRSSRYVSCCSEHEQPHMTIEKLLATTYEKRNPISLPKVRP